MVAGHLNTQLSAPRPRRPAIAALQRGYRRAQAEALLRRIARSQHGQPVTRVRPLLDQAMRGVQMRLPDRTPRRTGCSHQRWPTGETAIDR